MRELPARPLTPDAFAPYGQVIDLDRSEQVSINDGLTTRFHDLASIDVARGGGQVAVNVFRTKPIALPHRVERLERHPLGSQLFYPVAPVRFLVLVAPSGDQLQSDGLELFVTNGRQGVNFYRNTWHNFQLVLEREADFVVVDRVGPGDNLEEQAPIGQPVVVPQAC
ncbi:MAG: ureidoglycolate lyase [Pseudomonadota bacterium]